MALIGATAGIILAVTSHWFLRDGGRSANKNNTEQIDAITLQLTDDLNKGGTKPRPESLKKMKALEDLGAQGKSAAATFYLAWLQRMYDSKLGDKDDFKDLARCYLGAEEMAPQQTVKAMWRAKSPAEADYYRHLLHTFDKWALTALKDGLEKEALGFGDDYQSAAKSALPGLLADLGEEAVPALRETLAHPSPAVRRQALRGLARMGKRPEYASEALPDVVAALKDKEPSVRAFAALALGELVPLVPKEKPPEPDLVRMLSDSDPLVRLCAARTLSRHSIGVDKREIFSVVKFLLESDAFGDDLVKQSKVWWNVVGLTPALGEFAVWKGGISYNSMFWDETAAHVLLGLGPQEQFRIPPQTILEWLRRCPHDGRHLATLMVAQGDRDSVKAVVPELAKMAKDRASVQRRKALMMLGRLGLPIATEALPTVIELLDHEDGKTRWQAFLALMQLDPAAARLRVPPTLQGAVDAASGKAKRTDLPAVKVWTRSLWQDCPVVLVPATDETMGVDTSGVFRTPTDLDAQAENERIDKMLDVLTNMQSLTKAAGPLGKEAVPFLLSVWESTARNPITRARHGNRALALLGREGAQAAAAMPHLIQALHYYDQDEASREEMFRTLAKIGDPALPFLSKALDDPQQRELHLKILAALQSFGPKARPVVPSLLRALMSSNDDICAKAAETFGCLRGGGAQEAVPELRKLLKWADQKQGLPIVGASTTALMAIGGPLTAAADLFPGRTLKSHRHVVDALRYIGPEAKDAVPDLIALFPGDNQELRLVSVRAVAGIGKEAVPLLSQSLADPREIVRLSAVQALSRMSLEDSLSAVPTVQALANTESSNAVKEAIQAFLKAHQTI